MAKKLLLWLLSVNIYIYIQDCFYVNEDFHARFSAISRRYMYILTDNSQSKSFLANQVTFYKHKLNIDAMQESAQYMLGEQDFSSFRAANCQSNTPMRNILNFQIYQKGIFTVFDIQANAFLYHMVRNIVGCFLKIGQENLAPSFIQNLILKRDRKQAEATAPPTGLYLVDVEYESKYMIKKNPQHKPLFII